MVDRYKINWRTLKLKPSTYKFLEIVAKSHHEDFVKAIILFGSEAKGEAILTSDVDIALISTRPLTHAERRSIVKDIPFELECEVDYRIVCLRESTMTTGKKLNIGTSIKQEGVIIYENIS